MAGFLCGTAGVQLKVRAPGNQVWLARRHREYGGARAEGQVAPSSAQEKQGGDAARGRPRRWRAAAGHAGRPEPRSARVAEVPRGRLDPAGLGRAASRLGRGTALGRRGVHARKVHQGTMGPRSQVSGPLPTARSQAAAGPGGGVTPPTQLPPPDPRPRPSLRLVATPPSPGLISRYVRGLAMPGSGRCRPVGGACPEWLGRGRRRGRGESSPERHGRGACPAAPGPQPAAPPARPRGAAPLRLG